MDSIDAAIAYLESLDPTEKINYTQVAKNYGVNRSIPLKRFSSVQASQESQYDKQRLLNNQQLEQLIKWINELTDCGLPPSLLMLANFTKELSGSKPRKH